MAWATPYQSATHCRTGPQPGARAYLAWALATFPSVFSLGIFNCRTVRGGSTLSLHGEGRAIDLGFPVLSGPHPEAMDCIDRMKSAGHHVGVQSCIYWRRRWSAVYPDGRRYNGVHPHYDHIHVELNWAGALNANLASFQRWFGGGTTPTPPTTPTTGDNMFLGLTFTTDHSSELAKTLQGMLNRHFGHKLTTDGLLGSNSLSAFAGVIGETMKMGDVIGPNRAIKFNEAVVTAIAKAAGGGGGGTDNATRTWVRGNFTTPAQVGKAIADAPVGEHTHVPGPVGYTVDGATGGVDRGDKT